MRAMTPEITSPLAKRDAAHKSLFQNILSITTLESRFYSCDKQTPFTNSHRINILPESTTKIAYSRSSAKSLFWKILPVTSLESRFYQPNITPLIRNQPRINILEIREEKNPAHPLPEVDSVRSQVRPFVSLACPNIDPCQNHVGRIARARKRRIVAAK